MGINMVNYALAKAYSNMVAAGIASVSVSGSTLTFTLANGDSATVTLPDPEQGASVSSGAFDSNNNLILTLTDNSIVNCGKMSTSDVLGAIGDLTTMNVNADTIVGAINILDGNGMSSVSYNTNTKKTTITYKNGTAKDFDLSIMIKDANITDLKDVDTTGLTDDCVLIYDQATGKFEPDHLPTAFEGYLQNAKDYTDEQVEVMSKAQATVVDAVPATPENDLWYYYQEDGRWKQTIFINGVGVTIDPSEVNFEGVVLSTQVTDQYGDSVDTTKVATIASLKVLHQLVNTSLGGKVNKTDIYDGLNSSATDAPLSANQGKVLNENKISTSAIKSAFSSTDTNNDVPGMVFLYNQLSSKVNTTDRVTAISSASTDTQVPSAKCVYSNIVANSITTMVCPASTSILDYALSIKDTVGANKIARIRHWCALSSDSAQPQAYCTYILFMNEDARYALLLAFGDGGNIYKNYYKTAWSGWKLSTWTYNKLSSP